MHHGTALHNRLQELAADIGRARRCTNAESSLGGKLERIANHVEALFNLVEPTAAELARYYAPDDETAITEAIQTVDQRHKRLRHQLGHQA